MPSSKNSTRQNLKAKKIPLPKQFSNRLLLLPLLLFCAGVVSSCGPTYPSKTLTSQLTKLVKEEEKLEVTCTVTGKTLWVYFPTENLIDEEEMIWDEEGLDEISRVIGIVHRVLLSTDAELDFLAVVGTDIKTYGMELITLEYIPDLKQATMGKFSRGEFFMRSIKDIKQNPYATDDPTGKTRRLYDISFEEFISRQIIHRTKNIFARDGQLKRLFEVKSTSWSEKFGIIKIEFEFMKKTYDLTEEEGKIKPLDYVKMIIASAVKNYDFKDFQVFEVTDTFSGTTQKLSPEELKKTEIKLPKIEY